MRRCHQGLCVTATLEAAGFLLARWQRQPSSRTVLSMSIANHLVARSRQSRNEIKRVGMSMAQILFTNLFETQRIALTFGQVAFDSIHRA